MSFKTIVLCASALLVQSIAGQYCGSPVISVPLASCGCGSVAVSNNGGGFNVQSVGPIVPVGIAAATELGLAADLALSGTLPWLSAVEFSGQLPTAGTGSVSYGCGDGSIAITQERGSSGSAASYGINSFGLGGCGCGCGSGNRYI